MYEAVVIGRGIIGATVARALRGEGIETVVIDCKKQMAGTAPSGGHLKPSWLGGMKKREYEPAMTLLDELWGMTAEEFTIRPTGLKTTVYRVDTDVVLAEPFMQAEVNLVDELDNIPLVRTRDSILRCRLLIIAAGVWCKDLVPVSIVEKQGVSFRMDGRLTTPFIKPWAPYKQVVAHQQNERQVWVGDGSAILPSNWSESRTRQCMDRCKAALGPKFTPVEKRMGLRPYCKESGKNPCLVKRLSKRVWLVTGAAKMGTISAGWAAGRILSALP